MSQFLSMPNCLLLDINSIFQWLLPDVILLIIGGLLLLNLIGWPCFFIFRYIKKTLKKQRFTKEVEPLEHQINEALEELDNLYKPTRRVSVADEERFKSEHKELIEKVRELCWRIDKDIDILDSFRVTEFLGLVETGLKERMRENNQVYDSIQKLKQISETAFNSYNTIFTTNHYCTYSEIQSFLSDTSELESLSTKLLPKYNEYITDSWTKEVLRRRKYIVHDRKEHNEGFIKRELDENKTYFDTVLGQYPLNPQQRDSIVKLEDNCLVIASAGSGKTSTILGKAKYLVEKRNISPSKILLITYTKKAATELHERMKIDGMTCCTFHKLAKDIIAQVTGQAPSFCNKELPLNIFHNMIETNDNFRHAINNYLINQQSLMGLEHDYTDAFSYFEDRKKYGIQALFRDVDDKIIFTRSEEEKRLVSILTRLGIPFRYENAYQYRTATPERRQYKPDFTIYYLNGQGQWQWLYLEHYAIDSIGNVPQWFGEGTRGGWNAANQRYNEGIQWKRSTHQQYGTILIETTSADFRDGTVETKLRQQLTRYGVPIKERTDEELYDLMVKRNRKLEKSVYTLITSFITLMKANEKTVDGLLESQGNNQSDYNNRNKVILTDIIKPFYEEYQTQLNRRYEIDFTDAIIEATRLCRNGLWKHYDYILVDEFQDISVDRYKFLQALRSETPKTKLYCVGDDWQSIYRFNGSDMSLVYEFEKYFGFTEQCKIETTYRFHQPLIDKSSEFIMKNKEQKEKTIKTPDGDVKKTYLNFVKCDGEDENGVLNKVEEIVKTIPNTQSILLLGRYNYDAMSVGFKGKIDMKDSRIMVKINGRDIPFLSVHSAKGLEADNVILVNCNQGAYGFPSLIEDDPILDFVLSKGETYPFAEERRLFYVAMTRARMKMYVCYDQKRPSPFISEFLLKLEVGSYLCPRCLEGRIEAIRDGVATNGAAYRSFVCSNRESGCDFFETKYGDLTPPGIQITEEMTAQDIERLREARRNSRIPRAPHVANTNFTYGTQAPVNRHTPIGGFRIEPAELPPRYDEPQQGSADDLPF